jgi:hypothetical protein
MDYDKFKNKDTKLKILLLDREKRKGFVEKFNKVKIVYDTWKDVLPILKKIAIAKHNKNINKAKELYKEVYIKIGATTSIKRALSKSEIHKILEKKDYLGNFSKRMVRASKVLEDAQKYIQKGTTVCNIANGMYALYIGHTYREGYKSELSKTKRLRLEMQYGQRQMMHVISITAELASFAPPGIKEYLEYNMKTFQACGKTFDRVNKYAEKIEKMSAEIERLWLRVGKEKNSIDNTRTNLGNNTRKKGAEYNILGHKSYKK